MHLRLLNGIRAARVVVWAGGFRDVLPLLVLGLGVTLLFHDGTIDRLGPITFSPEIPVMVAVPLVLAVACGAGHTTVATPVVVRNARVHLARGVSYVSVATVSVGILWLGDRLAGIDTFAPSVRNLLLFAGLALLATTFAGVVYCWVPVVLLFGSAVLSPADDSPFSFYGLVFGAAPPHQVSVVAMLALAGLALAVWDPRSPGYLRRPRESFGQPK